MLVRQDSRVSEGWLQLERLLQFEGHFLRGNTVYYVFHNTGQGFTYEQGHCNARAHRTGSLGSKLYCGCDLIRVICRCGLLELFVGVAYTYGIFYLHFLLFFCVNSSGGLFTKRVPVCFVMYSIKGAPAQQPQVQAGQTADIQAQWAEYYRSIGYASYYGQQAGGQPGPQPGPQPGQPGMPSGEGKVNWIWSVESMIAFLVLFCFLIIVYSCLFCRVKRDNDCSYSTL